MSMTYSEASNFLNAIKRLEKLEQSGELGENEQKMLDQARAKAPSAQKIVDGQNQIQEANQARMDTLSRYRGMQNSFGFTDELVGAFSGADARDEFRAKDDIARQFSPQNYQQGQSAGQMGVTGILGALGGGALRGANMIKQMAFGSGLGAASTAVPQFSEGQDGFVNRVRNVSPGQVAIGAGIGAAAPVVGQIASNLTRAVQNLGRGAPGYRGPASMKVAEKMQDDQNLGVDIKAYLASLGDEGMLADSPGALRGLAQGVAVSPGQGQTNIVNALNNRSNEAGQRIETDVNRLIDEPNAAIAARQAERDLRSSVLGPQYDLAKESKLKFNIGNLARGLRLELADSTPAIATELKKIKDNLGKPPISAKRLHQARSDLSSVLFDNRPNGALQEALKPSLDKMDELLDTIPGYKSAREGWSDSKAIEEALDAGFDILDGGKRTTDPTELRAVFSAMTSAQQDAFRKGLRGRVKNMMGTARNDALGANPLLTGFNREKLEIVLGKKDAAEIIKRLRNEKTFATTKQQVVDNSQTAQRTAADREISGINEGNQGDRPSILTRTRQFLIDNPSNRAVDSIIYGSKNTQRRLLSEILTMQGPERDRIVSQLLQEAQRLDDPTLLQTLTQMGVTGGVMSQAPQ